MLNRISIIILLIICVLSIFSCDPNELPEIYGYESSFGGQGSDPGQFDHPTYITIVMEDGRGYGTIIVSDTYNGRVQTFDLSTGDFISEWSNAGSVALTAPTGITYAKRESTRGYGTIIVSDTYNGVAGCGYFDVDTPSSAPTSASTQLMTAEGAESAGVTHMEYTSTTKAIYFETYLVDSHNNEIEIFDENGDSLGTWNVGNFAGVNITGLVNFQDLEYIAFSSDFEYHGTLAGMVFIVDQGNNKIFKINLDAYQSDDKPNIISQIGEEGTGDGQFNSPSGIDIDKNNNIYVADTGNNRVQKFDEFGNLLAIFGDAEGDGKLNAPTSVYVTDDGLYVYVVDSGNSRVVKFANQTSQ
jgi:DNA-binding beta-propeller fold protein YncE